MNKKKMSGKTFGMSREVFLITPVSYFIRVWPLQELELSV